MVDDERFPLARGEVPVERSIRFRTLGCYPLTGAILSDADLKFTRAMRLPTFEVDGMTLLRRMAWVIDDASLRSRLA